MKSSRLTKTRTNDSTTSASSAEEHGLSALASSKSLRTPEARRWLKEQLTGNEPETTAHDITSTMPSKTFVRRSSVLGMVGLHADAQSSSTTVDSVEDSNNAHRQPGQESSTTGVSKTIDVAQAIYLLQELKKTASPDELVALHRALLPTKEVETVTSPVQATFEERRISASWKRKLTAMPPGLATRGGAEADLLRKPGDYPSEQVKAAPSKNNAAALDLADQFANPIGMRAATPSEFEYSQTGIYRHGTLRITNGAASPEPRLPTSGKGHWGSVQPESALSSSTTAASYSSPLVNSWDMPVGPNSEQSAALIDGSMDSSRRGQQVQRSPGNSRPSKESLRLQPITQRVQNPTRKFSFDRDGSVSPLSTISDIKTPRSQHQSLNHRASQISAEYAAECGIGGSPYGDKSPNALLQFATRLSTVYDSDGDEDATCGSPEAALSRLNGELDHRMQDEAVHGLDIGEARTSDEQVHPPVSADWKQRRRPSPQKVDSGYASDASFLQLQQKPVSDASAVSTTAPTEENTNGGRPQDESDDSADARSLYTFKEVLETPTLLEKPPPAPTHAPRAKKSLALLKLPSLRSAEKRLSLTSSALTSPQASVFTTTTSASYQSSSPESKKGQNSKKLQKVMPEAVKKQYKEEKRKLKVAKTSVELPDVPEDVEAAPIQAMENVPVQEEPSQTEPVELCAKTPPVELSAVTPPVELSAENEAPASRWPSFTRKRSKSLASGRGSSNNLRQGTSTAAISEEPVEVQRSWSFARKRSRSESRSRYQAQTASKRSSIDIVLGVPSVTEDDEARTESPGDENVPTYSDFNSVARSLGSGAYDISTNMLTRTTAPVPGAVQHQIQSPYQISTGLFKSKSMKGMTPEMASELARMKSRDFAHANTPAWQEQPRMATPKSHRKQKSQSTNLVPTRKVEDFIPEWTSKPAGSSTNLAPAPRVTQSMYAESIPPLPELPADVQKKAHRADEIVAKKLGKDSARSTPAGSARNSVELQPDVVKKAVRSKKSTEMVKKQTEEKEKVLLRRNEQGTFVPKPGNVNVAVREMAGSGSEDSASSRQEPESADEELSEPSPSSHETQHAGSPNWEHQAMLWRQRRESSANALSKPVNGQELVYAGAPPMPAVTSPSIVVSRYITPLGTETAARANARTLPAVKEQHEAMRAVVPYDDRENGIRRTDSNTLSSSTSTATFVTVKSWDPRPPKQDIPRTDSSFSTATFQTSVTTTTTTTFASSGGRNRAKPVPAPAMPLELPQVNGRFLAYKPSKAALAEQSRADSLARLTGTARSNSPDSSLGWLDNKSVNSSTTSLGTPHHSSGPRQQKSSPGSLHDRYSGGLGYGWERGAGFTGSAGTRTSGSQIAKRKSIQTSEEWGLDLSDVPVFLQRAN
jgi:serine/arginine repetitive matrix protein 2